MVEGKKGREFSSIRCLTFLIPLVSQLLQKTGVLLFLLMNFVAGLEIANDLLILFSSPRKWPTEFLQISIVEI